MRQTVIPQSTCGEDHEPEGLVSFYSQDEIENAYNYDALLDVSEVDVLE